ncbi:MAG: oligosaccharide flippase family protein, partial [Patescibacteria group bacterium]
MLPSGNSVRLLQRQTALLSQRVVIRLLTSNERTNPTRFRDVPSSNYPMAKIINIMFLKIKNWLFSNQTISQTIAKNTFWLFSGQMIGRLLRAAIVIYAARVLGAASWGAFSYALGIAAFLTIFSDIGINALITK